MFDSPRAVALGLSFREAMDDDRGFLRELYASTRTEELAPLPWTDDQKAAFLTQQFEAQHAHYRLHYDNTLWLVIEHGGEAIGRLYLRRVPSEYRIVDIAFLPQHRGQGRGAAIIDDIVEQAAAAGAVLTLHVEKNNPVQRLYARLGFVLAEDKGVYDQLTWTPPNLVEQDPS